MNCYLFPGNIRPASLLSAGALLTLLGACGSDDASPQPDPTPAPAAVRTFTRQWPETSSPNTIISDVLQTADGSTFVTGYSSLSLFALSSNARAFTAKLNTAGDTVWTRRYNYSWTSGGGAYTSRATWNTSLVATPDGGVATVGHTASGFFGNSSGQKTLLTKYAATGAVQWAKTIGDPQEGFYGGGALATTADGGFLVLLNPNEGLQNNFTVVKTDATGNVTRTNTYPGAYGGDLQPTADGNFVVTGTAFDGADSQVFLLKLTPSGSTLWRTLLGDTQINHAHGVAQLPDGSYAITGHTFVPGQDRQIMLLRASATGQQLALYSFGGTTDDVGLTIKATASNQCLIGGYLNATNGLAGEAVALVVSATGTELARKMLPGPEGRVFGAHATPDGGLLFGGYSGFGTGFVYKTRPDLTQ